MCDRTHQEYRHRTVWADRLMYLLRNFGHDSNTRAGTNVVSHEFIDILTRSATRLTPRLSGRHLNSQGRGPTVAGCSNGNQALPYIEMINLLRQGMYECQLKKRNECKKQRKKGHTFLSSHSLLVTRHDFQPVQPKCAFPYYRYSVSLGPSKSPL